jgi:hypothetical protein
LPAIVTHWERAAKPITRTLKVEELCKAFVLYREGKGLDKATLSEDRYISRRVQEHLGGHMAHELGVAEIRSFLDTAKTSDSLKHKLYKVGSLIFAYGKEQRVLVLNPFEVGRCRLAKTVDHCSPRGCQTNSAKNGQSTFYSDGSRVASLAWSLSEKGGASRSSG